MEMKKSIQHLFDNNSTISNLLFPIKKFKDLLLYSFRSDQSYIIENFEKRLGYKCNLNSPQTFNEKIQWLKLHDRTSLHTKCADKIGVREVVAECLGEEYLVPLYAEFETAEQFNEQKIPYESYVVKTNHDSGTVFVVEDKNDTNFPLIKSKLKQKLATNYYLNKREWQYKNIIPKITVEKLLSTENGGIPNDYKILCFNGKAHFIHVDTGRFSDHKRTFFDCNWKPLELEKGYIRDLDIPKPTTLNEMIYCAEKIAKMFRFVRVDFYDCDGKLYFGEITFHPSSGFGKFTPETFDLEWGKLLELK